MKDDVGHVLRHRRVRPHAVLLRRVRVRVRVRARPHAVLLRRVRVRVS